MGVEQKQFNFDSADGISSVYAQVWEDQEAKPRFILQISHGMCEYVERYDGFARFICAHGGVVCGNDHLGHGHTKGKSGAFGYFAKKDGEKLVVEDVHKMTLLAKERYPGLPLFLLGHSMGSLLARAYSVLYGEELAGAVYMGTSGANPLTGLVRFLARVGMLFGRAQKPATLLSHLAFSKYNDKVEKVRTENDWLTRDETIVDRYNADPWCTFKFTDRAAYDFANLVDSVSGAEWAQKLPGDLPYLLVSGEMDPVGDYGKGVEEVFQWMKQAGIGDVRMKLYEGARHELLNEINKEEVSRELLEWVEEHL